MKANEDSRVSGVPTASKGEHFRLVLVLSLLLLSFIVDLRLPLGVAEWSSYFFPLLLVSSTSRTAILIAVSVATGFEAAGLLLSPSNGPNFVLSLINRSASVVIYWSFGILSISRIGTLKRLELAKAQLTARASLLQATVDAIPSGLILYNNESTITHLNGAGREFLKVPSAQESISLEEAEATLRSYDESGRRLKREELPSWKALKGEKTVGQELGITRSDGVKFIVRVYAAPIILPDGMRQGAILTFMDITEIRKTEQALRESEERFHAIADNISQLTWMADSKGKMLWYNKRWYEYTGLTPGDMQDGLWQEIVHPDDVVRVTQKLESSLHSGESWEDSFRMRSQAELYRWFLSRAVPIHDEKGGVARWFGTHTDITDEQMLTEEYASTIRELETFSYSVSHDLRNPLVVVSSFASMLQNEYGKALDEQGNNYLSRIVSGAEKMNAIIDDMLSLARISRQEIRREMVDLAEVSRIIIGDLIELQQDRRIEIDIKGKMYADADVELVKIALTNLIGNAFKYTGKVQRPRIELGTVCSEGKTVFYVKDNGAGFDMKRYDRLFVPFQRLHSEREFSGTGVGLAIVDRVIKRHRGKIWAESAVGKGATFFFTLSD